MEKAYYNIGVQINSDGELIDRILADISEYTMRNIDGELMPELFGPHYTKASPLTKEFERILKG